MINNTSLLWLCQGLFILRVLGQVIVFLYAPSWLPAMEEWYSGLISYHILLPFQIILIIFMTKVSLDNTKRSGYFFITKAKTRNILLGISIIYFSIMFIRYILEIALVPESRWFQGAIPIIFHWVLTIYIFLLTKNKTIN
jgi:hypothetical protein